MKIIEYSFTKNIFLANDDLNGTPDVAQVGGGSSSTINSISFFLFIISIVNF